MIDDILREGFRVWKRNLKLILPFLLETAVYVCIIVLSILAIAFYFGIDIFHPSEEQIERVLANTNLMQILKVLAVYLILLGVTFLIVMVFFKGWEIKSCYDAIRGELSLKNSLKYTKSIFIRYLLLESLTGCLILVGLVLLALPFFFVFGLKPNGLEFVLYLITAFILLLLYLIIIALLFTYPRYALILSRMGVMESVKFGFSLLRRCFWDTVALYLLIFAFEIVLGIPFEIARFLLDESIDIIVDILEFFVSCAVVMPIATLWWVLMYDKCSQKCQQNV
jgi:hypothetical protein